jgi:muconolactone delta-isomerase
MGAAHQRIAAPAHTAGEKSENVLILVICRPVEGGDQDEFRRLVPGETAALRSLKAKGTLIDAWSPGRPGAVLTLEAPDADEAAQIVAHFPLVKAGQITTEIIPLHPIDL